MKTDFFYLKTLFLAGILMVSACQEEQINQVPSTLTDDVQMAKNTFEESLDLLKEASLKNDLYIDWRNAEKVGAEDNSILTVPIGIGDNALGYWLVDEENEVFLEAYQYHLVLSKVNGSFVDYFIEATIDLASEDNMLLYATNTEYQQHVSQGTQMVVYFSLDRALLSGYYSMGYDAANTYIHYFEIPAFTANGGRILADDLPDVSTEEGGGIGGSYNCNSFSVYEITQSVTDWFDGSGNYIDTTYGPWEYGLVDVPDMCPVPQPEDLDPDIVNNNPITPLEEADLEDMMAHLWEAEICEKENFTNNDCVKDIWEVMKENDIGFNTLLNFIGENPIATFCMDIQNLGDSINGNTQLSGTINNASITINLNSLQLDRSKLSIARTMLHEMLHAELLGRVIEAGGYDAFEIYAQQYSDPFLALWNYIEEFGISGWQHEYMADNYIQKIADGLEKIHSQLSSQGFINFVSDVEPCGQSWSWNNYFNYIAWEGLHNTQQFQTDIVNGGNEACFNAYRNLSDMESSTNKCN